MFTSEIKETVYIAISCIVAALVLGLVAFVLDLRSDMAVAQNDQLIAKASMEAYKTYNKYQNATLYGEDIIGLIREFEGTDIVVYIEDLNGDEGTYYIDREFRQKNSYFVSVKGLELGEQGLDKDEDEKRPEGIILKNGIKRDATYRSFLIFGTYLKSDIIDSVRIYKEYEENKSSLTKEEKEKYDAYFKDRLNFSEVTAIAVYCYDEDNRVDYDEDNRVERKD